MDYDKLIREVEEIIDKFERDPDAKLKTTYETYDRRVTIYSMGSKQNTIRIDIKLG